MNWDNMCESTIFLEKEGEREEIMKDVAKIFIKGDQVTFLGLLGEEKTITGELTLVDSVKHEVIVREK
ncbi:MAG: CooT family nickel-binding protein [Thermoplasmata archaeon]|nr:CooT family nickel-binding protein [Thermoplasmata archaeon]